MESVHLLFKEEYTIHVSDKVRIKYGTKVIELPMDNYTIDFNQNQLTLNRIPLIKNKNIQTSLFVEKKVEEIVQIEDPPKELSKDDFIPDYATSLEGLLHYDLNHVTIFRCDISTEDYEKYYITKYQPKFIDILLHLFKIDNEIMSNTTIPIYRNKQNGFTWNDELHIAYYPYIKNEDIVEEIARIASKYKYSVYIELEAQGDYLACSI